MTQLSQTYIMSLFISKGASRVIKLSQRNIKEADLYVVSKRKNADIRLLS